MKIRAYESDELSELIALFKCAVLEGAARDYSPEQLLGWANAIEGEKTWAQRLSGQMVLICERDGRLAGFAAMEANGHLDLMFVHPQHHRQGIASTLYSTLEAWAGTQGIRRIFTEASLTALPFFEKQGFEVIERQTVVRNGIAFGNFRMKKNLLANS